MPSRYRAPGGWTVDVITLSATPDHRDGEWLRVSFHGVHVADVRTVAELEQWFSLETLEETLGLPPQALPPARRHPHRPGSAWVGAEESSGRRRIVLRFVDHEIATGCAAGDRAVPAASRLRRAGRAALAWLPGDNDLAGCPDVAVAALRRVGPPPGSLHVHPKIRTRVR
jgi:rhodanese-related sulfurtransferase